MQKLVLLGIPMNLNVYRNAHFFTLNQEKNKWETMVYLSCREQNIKPVEQCHITFEFCFSDRRKHDPDNYALCAKFLLDGLVKAGVLSDDNFDVVQSMTVRRGEPQERKQVIVWIKEIRQSSESLSY